MAKACGLGTMGEDSARPMATVAALPNAIPSTPPNIVSVTASTRNCTNVCAPARQIEHRIPISRVLFGDADEHDVHHPNATDKEADSRNGQQESGKRAHDRLRPLSHLGLRANDEVLVPRLDPVPLAKDALDLVLGAPGRVLARRANHQLIGASGRRGLHASAK